MPTVLVGDKRQDLEYMEVVLDSKTETYLIGLNPMDATTPGDIAANETHKLSLASIAPLKMMVPLIPSKLFPSTAAYALVNTRAESLQLIDAENPLLDWPRRGLKEAVT